MGCGLLRLRLAAAAAAQPGLEQLMRGLHEAFVSCACDRHSGGPQVCPDCIWPRPSRNGTEFTAQSVRMSFSDKVPRTATTIHLRV